MSHVYFPFPLCSQELAFTHPIDQTLDMRNLLPWTHRRCLKLLYKTCGHHALLPEALDVPVHYEQTRDALFRGGYADVYKGKCRDQEVAVKVIRTYSTDELQKVINVSCRTCSTPAHRMTRKLREAVLQRGCDVEVPSP